METRKVSAFYAVAIMTAECWASDSGKSVEKCWCPQCHEILTYLAKGVAPFYCFPAVEVSA